MIRQHNDHFLPNDTSLNLDDFLNSYRETISYLSIVHVVDLIKNHEFDISYQISAFIEHASQDFSCHYQAARFWVDLNIPGEYTHSWRRKSSFEITEFLIRECFYRRSIYCSVRADECKNHKRISIKTWSYVWQLRL
jgi:hypothetical protein